MSEERIEIRIVALSVGEVEVLKKLLDNEELGPVNIDTLRGIRRALDTAKKAYLSNELDVTMTVRIF